jgi:hypothetical protein
MKNVSPFSPKLLVFAVFLGINTQKTVAQGHDAARNEPPQMFAVPSQPPPSLMLKYSLTSLIEPTPTIQFAVEHRLQPQLSLQHEIGYITSYALPNVYDYWGIRLHSEIRKYLKPLERDKKNTYMAVEIFGKYNESSDEFWYCRDFCQYSQRILRKRVRVSTGIAFEYGWQRIFRDNFLLDVVFGAGVKHSQIISDTLPPDLKDATQDGSFFSNFLSDMSVAPISLNFILGIKLGYVLK